MNTYCVIYYVRFTGRMLVPMDLHASWDAILAPLPGHVARCESDWDHTVTWIDSSKAEIPEPRFA